MNSQAQPDWPKLMEEVTAQFPRTLAYLAKPREKMTVPICPYCNNPSELVTGEVIYPGLWHLRKKQLYRCAPCSAWVGCHDGTTTPLGRLAKPNLRRAKMRAHAAFDPLWRKKFGWTETRFPDRRSAYKWLSEQLGITSAECHIGMFDVDMCMRVVEVCQGPDMTKDRKSKT